MTIYHKSISSILYSGSTDTVAYSTMGTKDPITAALNVVLGYFPLVIDFFEIFIR